MDRHGVGDGLGHEALEPAHRARVEEELVLVLEDALGPHTEPEPRARARRAGKAIQSRGHLARRSSLPDWCVNYASVDSAYLARPGVAVAAGAAVAALL